MAPVMNEYFLMLILSCAISVTNSKCNEAVCASLVSKCMLVKACECDMSDKNNCTCCKECSQCLAKLYTQCCACVGMCSATSGVDTTLRTSTVEELPDPIPGLFNVLTEDVDPHARWSVYSYPAHLDLLYFAPSGHQPNVMDMSGSRTVQHGEQSVPIEEYIAYHNCTVAYMATCLSLNKCRVSCQSMGAARYRWFHEHGCCECIGSTCLDFGKGDAHCSACPEKSSPTDDRTDELVDNEDVLSDDGIK